MMIGIDVVEVGRLHSVLQRTPTFASRFFTPRERAYCESRSDPVVRLAGTLAAKEAVMKALRLTPAAAWARRIEIVRTKGGSPIAQLEDRRVPVSITHEGDIAVAVALSSLSWD